MRVHVARIGLSRRPIGTNRSEIVAGRLEEFAELALRGRGFRGDSRRLVCFAKRGRMIVGNLIGHKMPIEGPRGMAFIVGDLI